MVWADHANNRRGTIAIVSLQGTGMGFSFGELEIVEVKEAYVAYEPPVNFRRVCQTLIGTVPPKYLRGLGCVVLTNFSGKSRRERVGTLPYKGRKLAKDRIAGLYHRAWNGQAPWIELFVDKIPLPNRRWRWFPMSTELMIAQVLFHELGHHVHCLYPEFRQREDVADYWRDRLGANFMRRRYWYILPFLMIWRDIYLRFNKEQGEK